MIVKIRAAFGIFADVAIGLFLIAALSTLKLNAIATPAASNQDPKGFILFIWLLLAMFASMAMWANGRKKFLNILASVAYVLAIVWVTSNMSGSSSGATMTQFQAITGFAAFIVVPLIEFADIFVDWFLM